MAAGIGSRYGGLKQISPVGPAGEKIIDYSIYDALRAGFENVVFVIKKDFEQTFRQEVGKTIEARCNVDYVFQEISRLPEGFRLPVQRIKPWGTAHAVLSCKHKVSGGFAVINADDFYGRSSFKDVHNHLVNNIRGGNQNEYCMVGYRIGNTLTNNGYVARGICQVDQEYNLRQVVERTKIGIIDKSIKYWLEDGNSWVEIPPDSYVSMNFWGFQGNIFQELEHGFIQFLESHQDTIETAEYFLPFVVNELIVENKVKVKVLPTNEKWWGVTYRKDMPQIKKAILELTESGIYPQGLWSN